MPKTVLPPNATALEVALDKNNAKRFDVLMAATSESSKTWSATDCPAALLPFLAWALSVDTWNSNWPEKVKRQVISSSVFVHRHKGTRAGLDMALKALDLGVIISEWFEHGGDPYTFKADVMVTTRGLTAQEYQDIIDVIASTKNARSHLSQLRVYLTGTVKPVIGVSVKRGRISNPQPFLAKSYDMDMHSSGVIASVRQRTSIAEPKYYD